MNWNKELEGIYYIRSIKTNKNGKNCHATCNWFLYFDLTSEDIYLISSKAIYYINFIFQEILKNKCTKSLKSLYLELLCNLCKYIMF